MHIIAKLLFHF